MIRVPKYLEASLKTRHKFQSAKLAELDLKRRRQGSRSQLLISSKDIPQFNFYVGQTYDRKKEPPIASAGWRTGRHRGDCITFHRFGEAPHFVETPPDVTFKSFQFDPAVSNALEMFRYQRPTNIQYRSIPSILAGQNVALTGETGSGKTLAYLAPIMNHVLRCKSAEPDRLDRQPYALIVLPTRELVEQIGVFARNFGSICGVGVSIHVGGLPKKLTHTGYDLSVTSMGMLLRSMKEGVLSVSKVRHLVLDEADTILDDSFNQYLSDIFSHLGFKSQTSRGSQLVLASATTPRSMADILGSYVEISSINHITTRFVHQIMPHVQHVFYRVHKFEKELRFLDFLNQRVAKGRRIIIFTNKSRRSNYLFYHLNSNGIKCARLNKYITDFERIDEYEKFIKKEINVLVTTDLGSRGVDFKDVTDVINYDGPLFVSDYIHRAGRTGRIGCAKDCQVTTFIAYKNEVETVNKLEYSLRKGTMIDNVNANIKRILTFKPKNLAKM